MQPGTRPGEKSITAELVSVLFGNLLLFQGADAIGSIVYFDEKKWVKFYKKQN
jgi:hypothetical protein